jgi:serine/threonine protein kinase
MSPEQTRGRTVDRRTDIWAFGCVLFEALAHHRAFGGETQSDTIYAFWSASRTGTCCPKTHRSRFGDCCAAVSRKMHRRLRDIGDARLDLEEALTDPHRRFGPNPTPWPPTTRRVGYLLAALLVGTAVGAAIATNLRPASVSPSRPVAHVIIPLPPGERLARVDFPAVAIAPDGSHVV